MNIGFFVCFGGIRVFELQACKVGTCFGYFGGGVLELFAWAALEL
jgi:hypothetical protein